MPREWWWRRYHPALRATVAVVYFGGAIALFVFGISAGFHTGPSESSGTDQSVPLTGSEIYDRNCARCHGSSLEGGTGPRLGPGSEAADETDNRIRSRIEDGKKAMPSFSSTLTDNERELVFIFLRDQQNP